MLEQTLERTIISVIRYIRRKKKSEKTEITQRLPQNIASQVVNDSKIEKQERRPIKITIGCNK